MTFRATPARAVPARADATLPPHPLPGLDPAFSRLVHRSESPLAAALKLFAASFWSENSALIVLAPAKLL